MKKIYLLAVAFMAMNVIVWGQNNTGICPANKTPSAIKYPYTTVSGQPYCVIIVSNSWDTAQVSLYANNGTTQVPYASTPPKSYINTDLNGGASFIYDCNSYNAEFVEVCSYGHGCCRTKVVAGAPLPIKLTAFSGRLKNDNTVSLDWSSAIELDSYQYEVQRSADGRSYQSLQTVKAAGSSASTIKYNFIDNLTSTGSYFYRLKLIDIDGSSEFSKVVYVNSKKGAGIITKIFPNPFTSEIQLIGATSADMVPGNIKVFTIAGQLVPFRVVGANAIAIDENAPKGMYIVKITNQSQQTQQFKLVKQ